MAEEATEAPAEDQTQQDTPNESGPEETQDTRQEVPENDYEKRYNDLRPEYDRTRQEVAQLRQFQEAARGAFGPEVQAQVLRQIGLDLDDVEDFEDRENESEEDRVARLEQWKSEFEQQQQEQLLAQQEEEYLVSEIEALEKEAGREFSDEELTLIARAAQASRLENGDPDVKGAYELLTGVSKSAREQYVNSKKAPKAPVGSPGEEQIDTSDDQARQNAMAKIVAAEMSSD